MNKIDNYINKLPQWQQDICIELRSPIHEAAPDIQEAWKCNSPAFTYLWLLFVTVVASVVFLYIFFKNKLL